MTTKTRLTLADIEDSRDTLADQLQALIDSGADLNEHRLLIAEWIMREQQIELMRAGKIVPVSDQSWMPTEELGAIPIRR